MEVSVVTRIDAIWAQRHSELFCGALGCLTFYNAENPHFIVLGRPIKLEEVKAVIPEELEIEFAVDIVDLTQNPVAKSFYGDFFGIA